VFGGAGGLITVRSGVVPGRGGEVEVFVIRGWDHEGFFFSFLRVLVP
jgi:hypothetical protein